MQPTVGRLNDKDISIWVITHVPSCGSGKRLIEIGRHGHSDSVAAFYAEMKNTCTARRALFVCVISGDIDIVGTMGKSTENPDWSVIDLDEITEFAPDKHGRER